MRTLCLLSGAALAALPLLASAAYAQDDDEIVVTATRAPARAETLPAEVDVIDIDAMQARGVVTLADALRQAPGLNVIAAGGAGQQTSLLAGGANSNHTLVLFDGMRINDPSTPGSSFDAGEDLLGGLARVEVVQGTMSAVFGSDAIGGVINLIPRHGGPGALNTRLNVAGGSFNTRTGGASADGTLGAFRYAVSAEGFASDGYDLVPRRMSTFTGETDGAWMATLTGVFDYQATHALSFDLLLRQRRAQADFDPFPFDFGAFNSFRGEDSTLEISRNDLSIARLGVTWALSDTLSLRTTYGGLRQKRVQSDLGVATDFYAGDRRFGDVTLTWSPHAATSIVAGVSAERDGVNIAEGFGVPPPMSFVRADRFNSGVFVTAQSAFDRFSVTGAARLDDYEGFGAHTTWRVGASYNLIEWARVYAAYGTSFRAPTLYERYVSFGNPNLDPEQARSWEVGANAQLETFGHARGLELSALYRHSDIKDLIDFGPLFTYDNVDQATIDTAEARLGARPFEWLTARLAYVYTDARDEATHAHLLRRPKDYWSAELSATRGALRVDLAWREVGDRSDQIYADDGFSLGVGETPSYAVTRLALAYEATANAELYVAADNLFNVAYEPANAFAGAPRTITAGLRARY
ncbi:MAG: TonB-dependent receptor [Proteobacteria bacterium]|nr:TonB-dependent receptor [Pseudomonadota bacterium]